MNKKYLIILIHISGWAAFFVFPFVLLNFPADTHPMAFREMKPAIQKPALLPFFLINNLLFILFFYLHLFYLLPKFYYNKKKARYFSAIFLLLVLAVYVPSFIKTKMLPPIENGRIPPEQFRDFDSTMQSARPFSLTDSQGIQRAPFRDINNRMPPMKAFRNMDRIFGLLQFLIIWFLSSIIFLSQRFRKMEQHNKEMKVQKLNSELSYLKAQINPHFLFNTLNNIYALSICQSEQTPEAILKLSAIMRYVTQDAEAEKVPLEKELDYLANYIALQQLRSNNHLIVTYSITGDSNNKEIAPLLLINYIENAFKHGVSNHTACFVNISIRIIGQQLTMEVINKKLNDTRKESTATGSNNTKRRLALQYPDKHSFSVDETGDLYTITLQLNLA